MVDIATVFVDWLDAGLFAQLTQCGRIDVFPVIDESCRQTVGEGVAADAVFSFDQVQILRAVMHQHDHTGACRITCLRITVCPPSRVCNAIRMSSTPKIAP